MGGTLMAKMPAKVMEKFNDLSAIKFMATVDKDGTPNGVLISSLIAADEETLVWANLMGVKTPKNHKGAAIIIEGKRYGPEQEKFLSDVVNLFVFNEQLWVMTSTGDERKRPLIDVFDIDGKFVDSFFLDITGTLLATHNDSVFVREKDEDELIHLVKYKVID